MNDLRGKVPSTVHLICFSFFLFLQSIETNLHGWWTFHIYNFAVSALSLDTPDYCYMYNKARVRVFPPATQADLHVHVNLVCNQRLIKSNSPGNISLFICLALFKTKIYKLSYL